MAVMAVMVVAAAEEVVGSGWVVVRQRLRGTRVEVARSSQRAWRTADFLLQVLELSASGVDREAAQGAPHVAEGLAQRVLRCVRASVCAYACVSVCQRVCVCPYACECVCQRTRTCACADWRAVTGDKS